MAAAEQAPAEEPSGPAGPPARQPAGPSFSGPALCGAGAAGGVLAWAGDEAGPDDDVWAGDPGGWPADEAAWPGGVPAGDPGRDIGREPPVPEDVLLADDPDAGLPGPAECAAARSGDGGRVRVAEAFGAGFTHRDAPGEGPGSVVPSATGFAAGGPADVMEPGPVLAALTGQAQEDGLGRLGDDELRMARPEPARPEPARLAWPGG